MRGAARQAPARARPPQEEERREALAVRFHRLWRLHRGFTRWRRSAALAAAVGRLHPGAAAAVAAAAGRSADAALGERPPAQALSGEEQEPPPPATQALAAEALAHAKQLLLRTVAQRQQRLFRQGAEADEVPAACDEQAAPAPMAAASAHGGLELRQSFAAARAPPALLPPAPTRLLARLRRERVAVAMAAAPLPSPQQSAAVGAQLAMGPCHQTVHARERKCAPLDLDTENGLPGAPQATQLGGRSPRCSAHQLLQQGPHQSCPQRADKATRPPPKQPPPLPLPSKSLLPRHDAARAAREQQGRLRELSAALATSQAALAATHCERALLRRAGLSPWRAMVAARRAAEAAAGARRSARLARAALQAWAAALVRRRWRAACSHVMACGRLRGMRRRQTAARCLRALWAWAAAGSFRRRQLAARAATGLRAAAERRRQAEALAAIAWRFGALRQGLGDWRRVAAEQAAAALLRELQQTEVAASHRARVALCAALSAWQAGAAAQRAERAAAARNEVVWGRVRRWLEEVRHERAAAAAAAAAGGSGGFDAAAESSPRAEAV